MQQDNQQNPLPAPPQQVVDVIANPPKTTAEQPVPPAPSDEPTKVQDTTTKNETKTAKTKNHTTPVGAILFAIIVCIGLIALTIYTKLAS